MCISHSHSRAIFSTLYCVSPPVRNNDAMIHVTVAVNVCHTLCRIRTRSPAWTHTHSPQTTPNGGLCIARLPLSLCVCRQRSAHRMQMYFGLFAVVLMIYPQCAYAIQTRTNTRPINFIFILFCSLFSRASDGLYYTHSYTCALVHG